MNRYALIVMAAFLLSGCATQDSEDKAQAEKDARDDAMCQSRGYQPGTLKYYDCRQQLTENRNHDERASLGQRLQGFTPMGRQ